MNKLIKTIQKIPKNYFSLNDVQKISDLEAGSLKVTLSRLVSKGEIIKLGAKLYTNDKSKIDIEQLACEIYAPSYISFQSALVAHNILSQQTLHLTLATHKRSKQINILGTDILYHHLEEKLFWGYQKQTNTWLAEPEKALLDLAYLSLNGYAHFDPDEMNLSLLYMTKLKKYLNKFENKKLEKRIQPVFDFKK